jgi:hypothetical protein
VTRTGEIGICGPTSIEVSSAGEVSVLDLSRVADLELEDIEPIRKPQFYEGQSYKPGWWWSSTDGGLVPYESINERVALITLDHDPDVTWIVAQPLRLHFEDRSVHVPDFLTRTSAGDLRLVDVTTAWRLENRAETRASFEATHLVCEELGWEYVVVLDADFDRQFAVNLLYLANFKPPPGPAASYAKALLEAASDPIELGELVEQIGPRSLIWPLAMHLLWHGLLRIDLYGDLEGTSLVGQHLVDVLGPRGERRDPHFPTSLKWSTRVRRERIQDTVFPAL